MQFGISAICVTSRSFSHRHSRDRTATNVPQSHAADMVSGDSLKVPAFSLFSSLEEENTEVHCDAFYQEGAKCRLAVETAST